MFADQAYNLKEISRHFQVEGEFVDAVPYGSGHINDTLLGRYRTPNGVKRYIHQRINHHVFKQPEKLMENIERVTRFARQQIITAHGDPERETLNLVLTQEGQSFYKTQIGEYWRTYTFIKGAHTYDVADNLRHVYNAAKAFGNFQKLLDSLPGERLHETIPNFHHTTSRFETFEQAVNADVCGRAAAIRPEIDFLLQRKCDACVVVNLLEQGKIPERVTHNDTKLNNVLIDDRSNEGICVIDLDTMMPGSALYDFGDLVRMGTATAVEDETDLSRVGIGLEMFEWLARGYMDAVRGFLTPAEVEHLAFAGKLITFEQALRFLGDYLNGDVYYKIHRSCHNLDRARTQIKMVAEMERKFDFMQATIEHCCKS